MQTLFRTLLLAVFAVWFGGFTFYVSIVVPIGTEVLGSPTDQGMITRQVTVWMNYCGVLALFLMLVECGLTWKKSRCAIWSLVLCLFMLGMLAGLFKLHGIMDAMIDPSTVTVSGGEKFYQYHRVYLWISTFQWIVAWIWLIVLVISWKAPRPLSSH